MTFVVVLFLVCMTLSVGLQWHSCRPAEERGRVVSVAGMVAFTICNYGFFLFLFINQASGQLFETDDATNRALFALEVVWVATLFAVLIGRVRPVLSGTRVERREASSA